MLLRDFGELLLDLRVLLLDCWDAAWGNGVWDDGEKFFDSLDGVWSDGSNVSSEISEELLKSYKDVDDERGIAKTSNIIAQSYQELGKYDKSVDSYKRAIQIRPDYAEAYKNFGNVLVRVNKIDEAISNY